MVLRSLKIVLSGSLAVLLSASMFLTLLHHHDGALHPAHDGTQLSIEFNESHLFCPICVAVFTCCTADNSAIRTGPVVEPLIQAVASQIADNRSGSFKDGRAPPLPA